MSDILDALIEERRSQSISYEKYLEKIIQLTRDADSQGRYDNPEGKRPRSINSLAKISLYDNLDHREDLALGVYEAVIKYREDGWLHNAMKQKKVKRAIKSVIQDDEKTESILTIVKNQPEFE